MSEKKNTIESIVADALLQKPLGSITIDGQKYTIDRPRVATLILVSKLISQIPDINSKLVDEADKLAEGLRVAQDCPVLGDIAAALILGAKQVTQQRQVKKKYLWGLITIHKNVTINLHQELADKLLMELSSDELFMLVVECLKRQDIPIFFDTITSLYEVNLLKPTSEVTTTASGQ